MEEKFVHVFIVETGSKISSLYPNTQIISVESTKEAAIQTIEHIIDKYYDKSFKWVCEEDCWIHSGYGCFYRISHWEMAI